MLAGLNLSACTSFSINQKTKDEASTIDTAQVLLNLVDSITKLPIEQMNNDGLKHIQQKFENQLATSIFDKDNVANQNKVVLSLSNSIDSALKNISILFEEPYSKVLKITDFISHFGPIEKIDSISTITKQPLPSTIIIDRNTVLKIKHENGTNVKDELVFKVNIIKKINLNERVTNKN